MSRTTVAATGRQSDTVTLATRAHLLSLFVAFIVLVWVNRHQWFNVDEWAFLVDRSISPSEGDGLGLFEPHNEHWSTIPIVGYRLLFAIFGVRTYLPYLTVLLVFHLVVVHLSWRLLRRVGVEIWLATAAAAVFALLGAGWENLTSAFQWQLFGPLALGLGALLLLPEDGRVRQRDAQVVLLLIAGLLFSGVAITMVVVVALAAGLRRRWHAAAVIAAVPAAVYGIWYLAIGHTAGEAPNQQPFSKAVQDIPAFVWKGLTGAIDGATGLDAIGPAILVVLVISLLWLARSLAEPWPLVLATASGSVVFLALTTIRRSGLGIDTAAASRYAYMAVAFLLPTAAIALDALLRRTTLRWAVLAVGGIGLLLVQLTQLVGLANSNAENEQEQKHRILAAAELARRDEPVVYAVPVPIFAPNLSVDEIAELDRAGDLPGNVKVTPADLLTARVYTQVDAADVPLVDPSRSPDGLEVDEARTEPADSTGCTRVVPESVHPRISYRITGPTALRLRSAEGGIITVTLEDGNAIGRPRTFSLASGVERVLTITGRGFTAHVELPGTSETRICDV